MSYSPQILLDIAYWLSRGGRVLIILFTAALPAGGIEIEDDLGMVVQMAAPPKRIVSLAPSNTELLFALELGDKLVGVTEFCNYPKAALALETVAGYSSLNIEKIIAVKPDLILAARGNDLEGLGTLRQMGFPVFALDIRNVHQLVEAIHRLGRLVEANSKADVLGQSWTKRLAQLKLVVDSLQSRPRVMWGYWGETVFTAGRGNIIDDVIHLAGGLNVGREARGNWPQVSLETVVSWAPEVILTTYLPGSGDPDNLEAEIHRLRSMDGWKSLPAVRVGRIYYLESDWLMRPGPRLLDAMEYLAVLLHPQAFEKK